MSVRIRTLLLSLFPLKLFLPSFSATSPSLVNNFPNNYPYPSILRCTSPSTCVVHYITALLPPDDLNNDSLIYTKVVSNEAECYVPIPNSIKIELTHNFLSVISSFYRNHKQNITTSLPQTLGTSTGATGKNRFGPLELTHESHQFSGADFLCLYMHNGVYNTYLLVEGEYRFNNKSYTLVLAAILLAAHGLLFACYLFLVLTNKTKLKFKDVVSLMCFLSLLLRALVFFLRKVVQWQIYELEELGKASGSYFEYLSVLLLLMSMSCNRLKASSLSTVVYVTQGGLALVIMMVLCAFTKDGMSEAILGSMMLMGEAALSVYVGFFKDVTKQIRKEYKLLCAKESQIRIGGAIAIGVVSFINIFMRLFTPDQESTAGSILLTMKEVVILTGGAVVMHFERVRSKIGKIREV